ncbi:MAG: nitrate reductase, partial [Arachnia sp.]
WKENNVDFGNPINLIPAAAGIIIGVGDVQLSVGSFTLGGIALGTIVTVGVYHLAHAIAPRELKDAADGASLVYDSPGMYTEATDDEPAANT